MPDYSTLSDTELRNEQYRLQNEKENIRVEQLAIHAELGSRVVKPDTSGGVVIVNGKSAVSKGDK